MKLNINKLSCAFALIALCTLPCGVLARTSSDGWYDKVPKGFVEEKESTEADPEGVADLSLLNGMGHPRLMMNAADFQRLEKKVTVDSSSNVTLSHLHSMIMTIADESVAATGDIEYKLDAANKRLLQRSREALRRIGSCSYAYRLTGEKKYLDKAVHDLETVVGFKDWNPKHFLDVGEMSLAVAIGYDWLYYSLPYDLRAKISRVLLERAIVPVRGHPSNSMVSNWNQVCYGGPLAAAVAVYGKEKTQCGGLINEVIANNGDIVKKLYDPDGVYPEGYSYWSYGTAYQTVIFSVLEKTFGNLYGMDSCEGLKKTPEWILMMVGVDNCSYCFGDSSGKTAVPKLAMWWFAKHYGDVSLLRSEFRQMSIGRYKTTMSEMRYLPMALSCANDIEDLDAAYSAFTSKDASPQASSANFFCSTGGETPLVLVRGDWSDTDSDRYLGFKGGKASASHGHMDAGSFVYDALGCRWSADVSRPNYATIENALKAKKGSYWSTKQNSLRWQVWRLNNRGHSTLTINDKDFCAKGFAKITDVYDTPSRRGATLDMTPVYGGEVSSALRTITLDSDGNLYVTDEITARTDLEAHLQWRMVTPASVDVRQDEEVLTQNGKSIKLKVFSSNPSVTPSYTRWSASGTNSWDEPCEGMAVAGYTASVPKGETVRLVTVLSANEVEYLPSWQEGYLDIHTVATGKGDAALLIMPDGTSMLIDAGDNNNWGPQHPDSSKKVGEWLALYIKHFLSQVQPGRDTLDYVMITHFHSDHIGVVRDALPGSNGYDLSGITLLGEYLHFNKFVDRGYPDYDFPSRENVLRADKGFIPHYINFVNHIAGNGTSVEKFQIGSKKQFRLVNSPKKYSRSFEIRNLAANGEVWTGKGTKSRKMYSGDPLLFDENIVSCVLKLRYGKFAYYNGGDIAGSNWGNNKCQERDFETDVAKICGPVTVLKADHHGYHDTCNPFFLQTLSPRSIIIDASHKNHPCADALSRMTDTSLWRGTTDIYITGEYSRAQLGEELWKTFKPWGHIVVRVYPGGERYQIFVLDADSPDYHVKYKTKVYEL